MAFGKTRNVGQSPADSYQLSYMAINGKAIAQGDAADTVGNFGITARQTTDKVVIGVGDDDLINLGASWRMLPLVKIPIKGVIPAFSRVFVATLYTQLVGNGAKMPSNTVPGGSVRVNWYGLRRVYTPSEVDFQNYKSGSAWGVYAGQIGVDTTSDKVGYFDYAQADYDTQIAQGSTGYFYKSADIKTEIQYRSDRNEDCYLIGYLSSGFGTANDAASQAKEFSVGKLSDAVTVRPYLSILYVPPLSFHKALVTSGRAIDIGGVLDADSLDSAKHLYMGFVDQGETGDAVKYWLRNTRTDRIARRLVIEATRAFASQPARDAANSSAKVLRSVDTYNLHLNGSSQIDELTPRGAWKLTAIDGTHYKAEFQADFTGSYVQYATNLLFSADNIVDDGGSPARKLIKIRTAKWGSGSVTAGDKWTFETATDTTKTEYATDSKSMMSMMPATTSAGDTADTAKERPVSNGLTQRLRASTYDYDDSGTNRSVIMLGDAENAGYVVGKPIYIFDGTGYEAAVIHALINTAGALPSGAPGGEVGDAIVTEAVLSRSYAAGAYLTPGLYIDSLAKSEDAFVDTGGAASGQNLINLTVAQSWVASDQITIINFSTGQTETHTIQAMNGGGLQVQTVSNLGITLAAGDLVVKKITSNTASFFMRGTVPEGATLGDRLALMRAYEARSSLQNIL